MRKIHILMFGLQIAMNVILSLLLFCGLLGENALFAFIYPIFVFLYLLADIFVTTLTTDLLVNTFRNEKVRLLSIVTRDLLIIVFWFCFLLYIDVAVLTLWGTICYAIPKVLKIIVYDVAKRQEYLHERIKI